MDEREKIIEALKRCENEWHKIKFDPIACATFSHIAYIKLADALIAANIGDVTAWKERAERMHKEALKQKQLVSDSKHREDALRNQLKCAMDMVSGMQHAKRTLKILYVSGVIPEEALRDAVKQAKLEIEEENDDDR